MRTFSVTASVKTGNAQPFFCQETVSTSRSVLNLRPKPNKAKKYHCINYDGRHGCTFDYLGSAVVKLCAYPFETNNTTKAVDRCPCVYESNQEIERYYNKNLDKEMTLCVCRV